MLFIEIYFAGGIAAIALQLILVATMRSNMSPLIEHIKVLNRALSPYGLFFDIENNRLISTLLSSACRIYSVAHLPPFLTWALIIQSLLFSWLNFLLIAIGFLVIGQKKYAIAGLVAALESQYGDTSNPDQLSHQLKALAKSDMPMNMSILQQIEIDVFIDQHIQPVIESVSG